MISVVHPFKAESNLICELCKEALVKLENGGVKDIEKAILSKLPDGAKEVLKPVLDMADEQLAKWVAQKLGPDVICQHIKMCESKHLRLLGEDDSIVDLQSLAKDVNSSNSTWKANENIKNKTKKELRER